MNDEKEIERIKKECGWDIGLEYPSGHPRNKDFFEADAQKVLSHGKSCYERGVAEGLKQAKK